MPLIRTSVITFFAALLAVVVGALPLLASAQEEAPVVTGFCAACHGQEGPSPFIGVPTIHGLPEGVIETALYRFREGMRPCRTTACSAEGHCPDMNMCQIVGSMSDEQLAELAEWYAAQPFPAHQDPFDPELAELGRQVHEAQCEICHTNFGSEPVDDAGMLRGQRKVYLRTAMEDFQQGRRSAGFAAMDELLKGLSDRELDALAAFYSGAAPELPVPD